MSEALRRFATPRQQEFLDAYEAHGTYKGAAEALGINESSVRRSLKALRLLASERGIAPDHDMTHPVPEGFHVKGVSTLYNNEGQVAAQWVKSQANRHDPAQMIEAFQTAFEEFRGSSPVVQSVPGRGREELLAVYPMGDPHIGMYAWADEAGEDFDCDIAERNLVAATAALVERSPDARTAIILNLGDFFHADTMENRTMRSGAVLDVDSRWSRVLMIGAKAMVQCIHAALTKHERVVVKNLIGNHDDHTSQALALALSMFYENNPRVEVDTSPSKFWYFQHGKVLIGSTHGDTVKPDKLPGVMAADQAEAWGKAAFRYWLTGHIHSHNVIEFPGCVWESFRTLAAKDAWHASMGYRSGRDMQSIIYHRDHGEIERHTMNISMLGRK